MFREMRRGRQALSPQECAAVLERGSSGVLAVSGDDGYPYAVPLSYVFYDGKIYFHCALTGHKLDAIRRCDKVSFCVIDQDIVVPEEYATRYRSVIAFGTIRVLEDPEQIRTAIRALADKYSPVGEELREAEIDRFWSALAVLELEIEHLSGKQAIELCRGN